MMMALTKHVASYQHYLIKTGNRFLDGIAPKLRDRHAEKYGRGRNV